MTARLALVAVLTFTSCASMEHATALAPTTSSTTATTSPPRTMAELVRGYFTARFGARVGQAAVRVFRCESHLDPFARNGQHAGLAQLSRRWQEARAVRLGYRWEQMFLARPNLAVAADIFREQGWRPWPICGRRA